MDIRASKFVIAIVGAAVVVSGCETLDAYTRESKTSSATKGALIGAGDTAPAMRYSFFSQWVVMLPLAYLLLMVVGWFPQGPLVAWTIAPLMSLVLTWRRLQSGRWKTMDAGSRSTAGR